VKNGLCKRALMVGGSSGIGLAVARELAAGGCSLLLLARRKELLQGAAAELRDRNPAVRVETLSLDVADLQQVREGLVPALADFGTPDLVYNGAGRVKPAAFTSLAVADLRDALKLNVEGTWNVLEIVVPLLRRAGGGHIVNVASFAGLVGIYGYSTYSASKFAVYGLSQVLRNELVHDNIRVQVLCPPDTATPQLEEENRIKPAETAAVGAFTGVLAPEMVAKYLVKKLGGPDFLLIPGFRARLSWYAYRIFPGLVHRIIDGDVRRARKAVAGPRGS